MKKSSVEYLNRLQSCDMSEEYKALNGLQRTSWSIKKDVLEVMRIAWDSGQEWAGLPARDDLPVPPYPFGKAKEELTNEEIVMFKQWSKSRYHIHQHNARTMSRRLLIERTLQLAEDYTKYPEFYFVWQLDFRSRKYPVESFMSPQVADCGKALLEFSQGFPINNLEDAAWLAIHGANLFGNNKVSFQERVNWACEQEDDIVRTAENPLEYTWWTLADKPWQFLSWCFEWYGLLREGWGYYSHLPCAADGSCNGLQHLSAILLDEEGGRTTNLVPSELPSDVYTNVSNTATELVKKDASKGNRMAQQCLELGIDRTITKRSVMIVPYSGTQHACRKYIQEALEAKVQKNGGRNPFTEDFFKVSMYLAKHVWTAINQNISSARLVMDYVKSIGKYYANANRHMEWITPTKFLVVQPYFDTKKRLIKTHLGGNLVYLSYQQELNDAVNKKGITTGASPNFIHSLDAAALTLTINKCLDEKITDFSVVHDSFGTHSSNMHIMSRILREVFVEMYKDNDVLTQLRDHACYTLGDNTLPHPPAKGNLDLSKVLESNYFFA